MLDFFRRHAFGENEDWRGFGSTPSVTLSINSKTFVYDSGTIPYRMLAIAAVVTKFTVYIRGIFREPSTWKEHRPGRCFSTDCGERQMFWTSLND